jgi:hypothetical protein
MQVTATRIPSYRDPSREFPPWAVSRVGGGAELQHDCCILFARLEVRLRCDPQEGQDRYRAQCQCRPLNGRPSHGRPTLILPTDDGRKRGGLPSIAQPSQRRSFSSQGADAGHTPGTVWDCGYRPRMIWAAPEARVLKQNGACRRWKRGVASGSCPREERQIQLRRGGDSREDVQRGIAALPYCGAYIRRWVCASETSNGVGNFAAATQPRESEAPRRPDLEDDRDRGASDFRPANRCGSYVLLSAPIGVRLMVATSQPEPLKRSLPVPKCLTTVSSMGAEKG